MTVAKRDHCNAAIQKEAAVLFRSFACSDCGDTVFENRQTCGSRRSNMSFPRLHRTTGSLRRF
jgi:hypothetical protein